MMHASTGPHRNVSLVPTLADESNFNRLLELLAAPNLVDVGLCVRGSRDLSDLTTWNDPAGWRSTYQGLCDDHLFFAQDIFGNQFSLHHGQVGMFDAETGDFDPLATTVDGWLEVVAADLDYYSGAELLKRWSAAHGPLEDGSVLMPRQPFVLGGDYEVHNLSACRDIDAMKIRGPMARRLADLPDGATVHFVVE